MVSESNIGRIQLLLVIVFIASAIGISKSLETTRDRIDRSEINNRELFVETVEIKPEPYQIIFETSGNIEARAEIGIVPQVHGRIVAVHSQFYNGGEFANDEMLFQIDPRDFELQVERLQAEVARAKTSLDVAQAESKAAVAEWSQLHRDKPVPDLVARLPQLNEAKANLNEAKAQLAVAWLDLERTEFLLPFNGRVLSSDIATGQYVIAGQAYGRVFDKNSLEVQASLDDKKLKWLLSQKSQKITISAKHLGKEYEYEGYFKRGAGWLDTNTRFATVYFGIKDNDHSLMPGIFVTVSVHGPQLEDIVLLPASALQKEGILWSLKPDQTIESVTPEIVYTDEHHIAVRGIGGSGTIISSKISGVTAGMRVLKIKKQKQA